jgi:hypothetical protein
VTAASANANHQDQDHSPVVRTVISSSAPPKAEAMEVEAAMPKQQGMIFTHRPLSVPYVLTIAQ